MSLFISSIIRSLSANEYKSFTWKIIFTVIVISYSSFNHFLQVCVCNKHRHHWNYDIHSCSYRTTCGDWHLVIHLSYRSFWDSSNQISPYFIVCVHNTLINDQLKMWTCIGGSVFVCQMTTSEKKKKGTSLKESHLAFIWQVTGNLHRHQWVCKRLK